MKTQYVRLLWALMLCAAIGMARGASKAEDLFAASQVMALGLEIGASELEAMKKDSHGYVRCTVREGGKTYADVGIHYRGNPEKEIASGKPDFTVTFNKFVSSQKFHGQRRLTLQGSREDPSYVAAPIALEMFRRAGVPAPRSAFARVTLNGRDLGLYVLIEGVNRDFLKRHFEETDGNLYDEGERTDVTGKLDKDSGKDRDDQSDVDALAAAALLEDPKKRWKALQKRLDVDRFLAFTALEVLLWQKDSYALRARKFRIYHDPASDRMVFFPKGVEQVLEKTDGPLVPQWKGVVTKALLSTPEGQREYYKVMGKLLDSVFEPAKVRARTRQLAAMIRPAAAGGDAEAGKKFDAAVTQFNEAVANRAAFLREQLKSAQ